MYGRIFRLRRSGYQSAMLWDSVVYILTILCNDTHTGKLIFDRDRLIPRSIWFPSCRRVCKLNMSGCTMMSEAVRGALDTCKLGYNLPTTEYPLTNNRHQFSPMCECLVVVYEYSCNKQYAQGNVLKLTPFLW